MSENSSPIHATFDIGEVSGRRYRSGRPVLIGGCPRSGTTLLRTMLNSHPDLAIPHETRFVVPAWRRRDLFGDLTRPENRRDVARWIIDLPNSRLSRLGITENDLIDSFAAAPPTLGSLMASCFAQYSERHDKARWGDKRPSYSRNLNAVFGLFPNAQFVNVVRDPRACVASMRKAWPTWGRLASATEVWERTDRAVQAARRKLPADQILEIRYEDLITAPQQSLEQLCTFLDLDTTQVPTMLDYHNGSDLPTGELHENAAKPVSVDGLQRWVDELDAAELAFIEHVLTDQLRHHGYEPTGTRAAVPTEQLTELKRLRKQRKDAQRRIDLVELKRKVTYRHPTADQT